MAKKKKYKAKRNKSEEPQENPENSVYSRFVGAYARSARRKRTPEEKKEYKKLALFLLVWVVFVSSVYIVGNNIEETYWENQLVVPSNVIPITALVYLIIGVILFFVWLVFNGGFKKIDVTKYEKPDDMGYDEFCKFIDKIKERQKKAKYFLILFVPFIAVMLVHYIIMVWGAKLAK